MSDLFFFISREKLSYQLSFTVLINGCEKTGSKNFDAHLYRCIDGLLTHFPNAKYQFMTDKYPYGGMDLTLCTLNKRTDNGIFDQIYNSRIEHYGIASDVAEPLNNICNSYIYFKMPLARLPIISERALRAKVNTLLTSLGFGEHGVDLYNASYGGGHLIPLSDFYLIKPYKSDLWVANDNINHGVLVTTPSGKYASHTFLNDDMPNNDIIFTGGSGSGSTMVLNKVMSEMLENKGRCITFSNWPSSVDEFNQITDVDHFSGNDLSSWQGELNIFANIDLRIPFNLYSDYLLCLANTDTVLTPKIELDLISALSSVMSQLGTSNGFGLKEIYQKLIENDNKDAALLLLPYAVGKYASLLNGTPDMKIGNGLTVFDFEQFTAHREIQIIAFASKVIETLKQLLNIDTERKTLLIFDEAWSFSREGTYYNNILKDSYLLLPSLNANLLVRTQSISDFSLSSFMHFFALEAHWELSCRNKPESIEQAISSGLALKETRHVRTSVNRNRNGSVGCFIQCGDIFGIFNFIYSPFEQFVFSTHPETTSFKVKAKREGTTLKGAFNSYIDVTKKRSTSLECEYS
jgi:hypothetical protein